MSTDLKTPKKFLVIARSKGAKGWMRVGGANTVVEARQLIKDRENPDVTMVWLVGRQPKSEYQIWEADWKFVE